MDTMDSLLAKEENDASARLDQQNATTEQKMSGYVGLLTDDEAAFKRLAATKKKGYCIIHYELKYGRPTFSVTVKTFWKGDGERDVTVKTKGDLEAALVAADAEFSRVNSRTDSEREHQVFLTGGEVNIRVPKSFYQGYLTKNNYLI